MARQWSAVKMLGHLSTFRNTLNSVHAADMGRAVGKVEGFEESLGARSRALASLQLSAKSNYSGGHRHADGDLDEASSRVHCGKVVVVGEVDLRKDPTARPLIAERLHFLVTPGFDPRKFFDKSILQLHDFPLTHGRDLATVGEPPKVSRFVRARRQSLTSSRRWLRPISEGKFLDKYRSGLFALPKDAEKDRMVRGGRPAAMVDQGQNKWCYWMASAACLASIYREPDKVLLSSGED